MITITLTPEQQDAINKGVWGYQPGQVASILTDATDHAGVSIDLDLMKAFYHSAEDFPSLLRLEGTSPSCWFTKIEYQAVFEPIKFELGG